MIVVLTDLRRDRYLAATLAGVDESATGRRVVIVDGDATPPVPPGWEVSFSAKPPGAHPRENRWATWDAFELAAAAGEDLVFLEDDVSGCPGAAEYAERLRIPDDCAFMTLFDPWIGTRFGGIARLPGRAFNYCQALKFPLRTVRELVVARPEMEAIRRAGSDDCIRAIATPRRWLFGVHVPGLYEHVGAESVVSPAGSLVGRTAASWMGQIHVRHLAPKPYGFDLYEQLD